MTSSDKSQQNHPDSSRPSGADPAPPVTLTFDPHRLVRNVFVFCVAVNVMFVLLDHLVNVRGWADIGSVRRIFNTGREDALAAWFAITQTFMVALTLWLTFVTVKQQGGSKWRIIGWLVLALFFTYMAADDGARLHERLGSAFKAAHRHDSPEESWAAAILSVFPSYTWQIVFLPMFGALGLFTMVFLWRELDEWRSIALVGVALGCLVLAVSMDFVEGLDADHPWNPYTWLADRFGFEGLTTKRYRTPYRALRHYSKSIEESIEMLGMTILWIVLLRHWFRMAATLQVRFVRREPS